MTYRYVAFSFGGGVQSTALLLMLKHEPERLRGVAQLPDKAYFADTGAEVSATHEHLAQLRDAGLFDPNGLEVVSNGSLLSDTHSQRNIDPRTFVPLFTPGINGRTGMLKRKCTREFKVVPIQKAIRRDLGMSPGQRSEPRSVGLWLGISCDESSRQAENPAKWIKNLYPLVELGVDRAWCYEYCRSYGWSPPKSRCFMCPFTSDWISVARNTPQDFERAVKFDEQIRAPNATGTGLEQPAYVHRSLKPLALAVENQGDLFEGYGEDWRWGMNNECLGYCGT